MIETEIKFFTDVIEEVANKSITEAEALKKLEKLSQTNKERLQIEKAFKAVKDLIDQKSLELQQLKEEFYSDHYTDVPREEEGLEHTAIASPILGIPISMYEKLHLWCCEQFQQEVHFNKVYWTLVNTFDLSHSLAMYFTKEGLNTFQISLFDFSKENIDNLQNIINSINAEYKRKERAEKSRKN